MENVLSDTAQDYAFWLVRNKSWRVTCLERFCREAGVLDLKLLRDRAFCCSYSE